MSSHELSPLWAQSFALQSSSTAGHKFVTAVLKDGDAFSFSSQEMLHMDLVVPQPHLQSPCPCQGTLSKVWVRAWGAHTAAGLILTPPPGCKLNVLHSGTLLCETWNSSICTQDSHYCSLPPSFPLHAGLYQLCCCSWWGKKGISLFLTVILFSLLLWKHVCA